MSKSSKEEFKGKNPRDLKTLNNPSHNPALSKKRMEAFVRSLARLSAEKDFHLSATPKSPK
ncbi:MAG: hypothetical protein JKY88_18400 [Pseudomonadales bacterium]|nr:hypothetical protein [Pseudomonadales bacterium]